MTSILPSLRNQIANMLGYCMVKKKFFGDSHNEAINIIEHKTKGWQDRCHEVSLTIYNRLQIVRKNHAAYQSQYTWYELLHLVSTSCWKSVKARKLDFKKSFSMCTDPKKET